MAERFLEETLSEGCFGVPTLKMRAGEAEATSLDASRNKGGTAEISVLEGNSLSGRFYFYSEATRVSGCRGGRGPADVKSERN